MPETNLFTDILPAPPQRITRIGGGRNSRVFKADCTDGQCYVVKEYFQHPGDPRDRRRTEWLACTFMHENGITCIPKAISLHDQTNTAVFEYIEGKSISSKDCGKDILAQFCSFWELLYALRKQGLHASLPAASDACFSLDCIAHQLEGRVQSLLQTPVSTDIHSQMHRFIRNELQPRIHHAFHQADLNWARASLYSSSLLDARLKMPSPSDFGLHNAIQSSDGKIFFVDFEYFGMDDPVKLLSDTCLHPAMSLSKEQQQYLVAKMKNIAESGQDFLFEMRLENIFSLWRYKWCCIILNAFVPQTDAQRRFSWGVDADNRLLQEQLAKAIRLAEEADHVCE